MVDAIEDEEVIRRSHYEVHEGLIFVIELTDSMLIPNPETGKPNLLEIFEALQESMAHSIITLPNSGYGCYLFNGENTTKGLKPGIERLFPLTDLNYKSMKVIQDILEENSESKNKERPYRPLDQRFNVSSSKVSDNPLHDVLSCVQDDFLIKKEFQKQYNNKKIFLFTDNDEPIDKDDTTEKNLLRKLLNDLDDDYINIVPFFLSAQANTFSPQLYSELFIPEKKKSLEGADKNDATTIFDGPNTKPINPSLVKQRVLRRKEVKRIQFQCPFIFSEHLVIGVKGYSIYTHEKPTRTKYVFETEDFRKNVYSKRRFINPDTGAELQKTVRLYRFGTGDDFIRLSDTQQEEINRYSDKYDSFIRLLGFKNEQEGLKLHYNTSKIPFITPDEDKYDGSTRTLSALYQTLAKTKKVAILFGKLRKSSQPAMYALHVSEPPFPEGFFLIRLPFLDDIRRFPEDYDAVNEPSRELYEVTLRILRKLELKHGYTPKEFRNPAIQRHFKVLHDFLLQKEQEEPEDEEQEILNNDDTLKKLDGVRKRIEKSQLNEDENPEALYNLITRWNSVYNRV